MICFKNKIAREKKMLINNNNDNDYKTVVRIVTDSDVICTIVEVWRQWFLFLFLL
jgi:hypothetical protein